MGKDVSSVNAVHPGIDVQLARSLRHGFAPDKNSFAPPFQGIENAAVSPELALFRITRWQPFSPLSRPIADPPGRTAACMETVTCQR